MAMILAGDVTPEQVGAFLMLLRVKEESPEEIAGFVSACRQYVSDNLAEVPGIDLDWSSYAGKRRQPNWYVLAILLLASNGFRVLVHGARGHTAGRIYTQDIFEGFNLPVVHSPAALGETMGAHGFCFVPLQTLCPPLEKLIQMRRLFGLRSPVHTLCRLLNPLAANATLQSVFHPNYANTHNEAARLLGEKNAMVIKGDAGEFEFRPQANLQVKLLRGGRTEEFVTNRAVKETALLAPGPEPLRQLWRDKLEKTHPEEATFASQAVTGTVALALLTMNQAEDFAAGFARAESMWKQRDRSYLDSFN